MDMQIYSDMHKDCYGFRPRHNLPKTQAEYERSIARMQAEMFSPERVERERREAIAYTISNEKEFARFAYDNYFEIMAIAVESGNADKVRDAIRTAKNRGWSLREAFDYNEYLAKYAA